MNCIMYVYMYCMLHKMLDNLVNKHLSSDPVYVDVFVCATIKRAQRSTQPVNLHKIHPNFGSVYYSTFRP